MTLAAFGEIVWDVYPDKQCLGGAPLNFAAHAARHGMEAYVLSAVGDDDFGAQTLAQMRQWGVHTEGVCVHPDKPTGICEVTLDERFVPTYHLREDTAWDAIECRSLPCEPAVLYFGTLALRSDYNRAQLTALLAKGSFKTVFADVNIRAPFFTPETVRMAFENATIVKVSDEELPTVCNALDLPLAADAQSACRALARAFANLRLVILTCGGDGAYAYDTVKDAIHFEPAVKTTVVSTVGAGDSFSAAFLQRYCDGQPLAACMAHAAKTAAMVVSHLEAVPPYSVSDLR